MLIALYQVSDSVQDSHTTLLLQIRKDDTIMANITYRQVADYMIPNIMLSPEETSIRLGKWGMLYKEHLFKHNKVLFTTLLTQGKLYQHCAEVENQAQQMFETIVNQMKEAEGVTEQLKEENQSEWVCRMQNIEAKAKEMVYTEFIYV